MRGQGDPGVQQRAVFWSDGVGCLFALLLLFFNPNACENKSAAQPVRLEVCPCSPQLLWASAGKSHGEDRAAPNVCLPSVLWHRPGACLLSPVPLPKAMARWSTRGTGADPWLWRSLSLCAAASNGKNAVRLKRKRPLGREVGRHIAGIKSSSMQFCLFCLHSGLCAGGGACSVGAWLCCRSLQTHCVPFLLLSTPRGAHSNRVPAPMALGVSLGPNPTPGGFPVCASLGWDTASVGCVGLH